MFIANSVKNRNYTTLHFRRQ